MTIKDMEVLFRMTRANIRFYEAEGLLKPTRNANGYRDYSENDLEVLKRIKLLRTLHISLEEIKSLHTGELELVEALNQHIEKLHQERRYIDQEICREMSRDGVRYETLNAQYYLDAMGSSAQKNTEELKTDVIPKVNAPFRRFLARGLDLVIYTTLWNAFLALALGINIVNRTGLGELLDTVVVIFLMMLVEPILLSRFKTSVGKWIFGMSVTDSDYRHLTYYEGLCRTWDVFVKGMGLSIPIYNLVRLWKSYTACSSGETLEWESDTTITIHHKLLWHIAAFVGVTAAVFSIIALSIALPRMPKNREEISVSEFCQNYNRLAKYYDVSGIYYLNDKGSWVQRDDTEYIDLTSRNPSINYPEFIFTEENGIMKGMRFTTKLHNDSWIAPNYKDEMMLSIMSFVQAQSWYNPFSKETDEVLERVSEAPFEDFQFALHDITIKCDFEYKGYVGDADSGIIVPQEEIESDYYLSFVMEKK